MVLDNFGKEKIGKLLLGLLCLGVFGFFFVSTFNKSATRERVDKLALEKNKKQQESEKQIEDLRELREKLVKGSDSDELKNPEDSSKSFREMYAERLKRRESKEVKFQGTESTSLNDSSLSPFQREVNAMDQMSKEATERRRQGKDKVKEISLPFLERDSQNSPKYKDSPDGEFRRIDRRTQQSQKSPFTDLIAKINSKKPSEAAIERRKLLEALFRKIEDRDQWTALIAGETFFSESREEHREYLANTLKDGGGNILQKLFLIKSLGKVGDESSIKALRFEYSHASDEIIRQELVKAVGEIGHPSGETFLNQILAGDLAQSSEVVKLVYAAFAKIGSPSAKDRLFNLNSSTTKRSDPGEKAALAKAYSVVAGEVDNDAIDKGIPGGSKLNLRYKGTEYFFYHPAFRDAGLAKPWLLVCVHGSLIRAEEIFDICRKGSKNRNVAVLAPVFDHFSYPDFGFLDRHSSELRADLRFWEIVEHVAEIAGVQTREMFIYGEEKGGDFVARVVMDQPGRFSRAVAYNADYPKLTGDKLVPEGIKPSPLFPDIEFDIYGFIKTDFLILTPSSQGSRTRGSFYKSLTREAIQKGYSMRISTKATGAKKFGVKPALDYLFKNRPKGMKYQR